MHSRWFFTRLIFNVLLVAALVLGAQAPAAAHPQATTFTINTSTDAHDSNLSDGICNNGIDGCNLRAAIEQSFSVASVSNPVTILFWSSGSVLHNLNLGSINWAASYVALDGQSLGITIDGSGMASGQNLIAISGDHNTIRNLTLRGARNDALRIGDFAGVGAGNDNLAENLFIIGSGAVGVYVYGGANGGGKNNTLQNSVIGASSWLASSCVPAERNGSDGVKIDPGANGMKVMSSRIVCNGFYGVHLNGYGGSLTDVDIQTNDIGLYVNNDMGNSVDGIMVDHASNSTIRSNVISGNGFNGVALAGSTNVTLTHNYIGTNSSGTAAMPNDLCGVAITGSAANNVIGGEVPINDRNLISGNAGAGVCISGNASYNTIESNFIGLNLSGTAAVPNGGPGVSVDSSGDNFIGTSMAGAVQYISGNGEDGIFIENGTYNFIGPSNRIGMRSDGNALGNGRAGIWLSNASETAVFPTSVVFNTEAGIVITGTAAISNYISAGSIYGNGGLPIDLGNDGRTPNGSHTGVGPNGWQTYPVITSSAGQVITGTSCANCTVRIYRVYMNPGEKAGGGSVIGTVIASAAGVWSFTLPAGATPRDVTMTACQGPCAFTGNTSEMSPVYLVFAPVVGKRY